MLGGPVLARGAAKCFVHETKYFRSNDPSVQMHPLIGIYMFVKFLAMLGERSLCK